MAADQTPTSTSQAPRRGTFITFEGGDGVGKTTHIRALAHALESRGFEVVRLREPGGTRIGEALRAIVLDPENAEMADVTELFVYEAARAQIVAETIKPALDRGAVVLCDRFADSTLAYQGYGRGIDLDAVKAASNAACQGVTPDRTLLMRLEGAQDKGLERAAQDHEADRLELAGNAFQQRVLEGFARIAEEDADRVRMVASHTDRVETARGVFAAVADLFGWTVGEGAEGAEGGITDADLARYLELEA